MAAPKKVGWGHQQGPRGILPESVEDPSEGEVDAEETETLGTMSLPLSTFRKHSGPAKYQGADGYRTCSSNLE